MQLLMIAAHQRTEDRKQSTVQQHLWALKTGMMKRGEVTTTEIVVMESLLVKDSEPVFRKPRNCPQEGLKTTPQ